MSNIQKVVRSFVLLLVFYIGEFCILYISNDVQVHTENLGTFVFNPICMLVLLPFLAFVSAGLLFGLFYVKGASCVSLAITLNTIMSVSIILGSFFIISINNSYNGYSGEMFMQSLAQSFIIDIVYLLFNIATLFGAVSIYRCKER